MDTSLQGRAIKASLLALGIICSAVTYKLFSSNNTDIKQGGLSASQRQKDLGTSDSKNGSTTDLGRSELTKTQRRKASGLGHSRSVDDFFSSEGADIAASGWKHSDDSDDESTPPPTPSKLSSAQRRKLNLSAIREELDPPTTSTTATSKFATTQPTPTSRRSDFDRAQFLAGHTSKSKQEGTEDLGFLSDEGKRDFGRRVSSKRRRRTAADTQSPRPVKPATPEKTEPTPSLVMPGDIEVPRRILGDGKTYQQAAARVKNHPGQLTKIKLESCKLPLPKANNWSRTKYDPGMTVTFTFVDPDQENLAKQKKSLTFTMNRSSFAKGLLTSSRTLGNALGIDIPSTCTDIEGLDNPGDLQKVAATIPHK